MPQSLLLMSLGLELWHLSQSLWCAFCPAALFPGNNPEGHPSPPTSTLPPTHRARSQAPFFCRLAGHGSPPGGDGGGMATQGSGQRSNRASSEPPCVNHRSPGQFQVTGELEIPTDIQHHLRVLPVAPRGGGTSHGLGTQTSRLPRPSLPV